MSLDQTSNPEEVVFTGWMHKKKIKKNVISASGWKRRYFVLKRSGLLFYYTNQTVCNHGGGVGCLASSLTGKLYLSQSTTPLGFININASLINSESKEKNQFTWELHGAELTPPPAQA